MRGKGEKRKRRKEKKGKGEREMREEGKKGKAEEVEARFRKTRKRGEDGCKKTGGRKGKQPGQD